ncbi:MAG: thioesterase family protein [Pseudomonadales bacterium]|nr:thioesterase family protein [Pseudomonadales bacterium]
MTDATSLTDLLTLSAGEDNETWIGAPETYGAVGIYGGHFLGQALSAAFETVTPDKLANSLHAYFLKAGNPALPLAYRVKHLRDGRGYELRSVACSQQGEDVFHMTASFKTDEDGDEHQKTMPTVPDVEHVVAERESRGEERFRFPMTVGGRVEMELISDHFVPPEFKPGREPRLQCWMRVPNAESSSQRMRQCMLAFLADGTLMFNSALPYGVPFRTHRLTSLDQSVWFHRTPDVSQWMLYDQRSTAAADARGLNEGEAFDQTGRIIMSTAQESMLRRVPSQ